MTAVPELPARTGANSRTSWWLTALGIGVALAMLALGALAFWESRNDTWQQAEQSARNLLLALDRDIGRNVTILDLSLQGVVEALAEPGIEQATPGVRHHALFDRSASAEDLGSILILDDKGEVVEDSTALTPHRLSLSDRDYFQVHRDDPNAGLFVSRPFASRLAGGDLRFAISRRLPDVHGQFAGIVEGTLRLNYFLHLFEKLELGAKGTITLLRSDGRILIRYPFAPADIDRDVSGSGSFREFLRSPAGQYVTTAAIDGVERLYTFRRIGGLPLILTVNLSTDEILAPWRRKAAVIGPVLILLCSAVVASCLLFRREMLRRAVTEQALADAAERLSLIASTDGLTGLANRRAFETEFERAFRRAVRAGTSLAILMLDADFFKRYNDTYGHPAGDEVLRAIANCIGQHMRRPDDVGARYGGEEFVALLPDTDLTAAAKIAERIRAAIADLGIEHSQSSHGHVSVSVGLAVGLPFVSDHPAQLLQAADQALYAAKNAGRNRVESTLVDSLACPAEPSQSSTATTFRLPASLAR